MLREDTIKTILNALTITKSISNQYKSIISEKDIGDIDKAIEDLKKESKSRKYTGIYDKNNIEVKEGDFLYYKNSEEWGIGKVIWNNSYLRFDIGFMKPVNEMTQLYYFQCKTEIEVIGNEDDDFDSLCKKLNI